MKKDIADKWVEALRSGKYKQTRNTLKRDNGHCCLGVLCEIVGEEFKEDNDGNYYLENDDNSKIYGYLPKRIKDLTGIKSDLGVIEASTLSVLNDNGKSFTFIANIIEQNWEKL